MNRLAPLLVLLALAPARAQPPARVAVPAEKPAVRAQAPPAAGAGVFHAAPPAGAADAMPAVQAAVDLAIAYAADRWQAGAPNAWRGYAHVPAADTAYTVGSPLYIDANNVELGGDGANSKLVADRFYGGPIVTVGISRPDVEARRKWASWRPDGFGKLDATAAPAAGKVRGIRSRGEANLSAFGSALTHGSGDNWADGAPLTVEFAAEGFGPGGAMPDAFSVGTGQPSNGGAVYAFPWLLTTYQNTCYLWVSYITAPAADPVTVRYHWAAKASGVGRYTFQIDTTSRAGPGVAAWMDGHQAAVVVDNPAPTVKCALAPNPGFPFQVGQLPGSAGPIYSGGLADVAVYGLSLSKALRYKVGAAGSDQVRADGLAITDQYRYFPLAYFARIKGQTIDDLLLAYLLFDDDPATFSRHLFVQGGANTTGYRRSVAFLMERSAAAAGGGNTQVGNAVRNLEAIAANGSGMGILQAGGVLDLTIEDVGSTGDGVYGIAVLPTGASYTTTLRRVTLAGTDAGYLGFSSLVRMRDVTWKYNGRHAIRAIACSIDLDGGYVVTGSEGYMECFFRGIGGEYGGNYVIRNTVVNNENTAYLDAPVRCEANGGGGTTLRLDNVTFSAVGNVPAIRLRQGGANRKGWLVASMVAARGGRGLVEADGPGWQSRFTDMPIDVVGPAVLSTGTFGPAAVTLPTTVAGPGLPVIGN